MALTDFNQDFKIPFRNFVLDDLEVSSLIEDRFYGAYLATFYTQQTSFPLATFHAEGGNFPNLNIIQKFFMRITAYSDQHYDEAYTVYKAIYERLGGENGPVAIDQTMIVRPITTPTETYDEESRLYGITSRFSIIWIS